jgi:hypothetical protein
MNRYRFSPIQSESELFAAMHYVARQSSTMCNKIIGEQFPIESLKIFSHYQKEFEFLCRLITGLGNPLNENNGPRITLTEPFVAGPNLIGRLRIRKPDVERPQVGCNDFVVSDYAAFKERYLSSRKGLRLIERPRYEMIEFFDSDFDVLAYVVSK